MTTRLTLAIADMIAAATLARARELKLAPVTVVVLDPGGHFIVLKREDGAGFLRHQTAHAKAYGALGLGAGTRFFFDMAAQNPAFVTNLVTAVDGDMFPSPGGVLICNAAGEVIGAVGVSGDAGPQDEAVAIAGIEAASLRPVVGAQR